MKATPRQILNLRYATMLLGDDVVYLERQGVVFRRQMAVLASVPCELLKLMQHPAFHHVNVSSIYRLLVATAELSIAEPPVFARHGCNDLTLALQ